MSERAEVKLASVFHIKPEDLTITRKRVPLDRRGYIPLHVFNRPFAMAEPSFVKLGEGAVAMSLGQPFGFMQTVGSGGLLFIETQQTDGVVLAPAADQENRWCVTFDTPEPITPLDVELFTHGISFYAAHAEARLHRAP